MCIGCHYIFKGVHCLLSTSLCDHVSPRSAGCLASSASSFPRTFSTRRVMMKPSLSSIGHHLYSGPPLMRVVFTLPL